MESLSVSKLNKLCTNFRKRSTGFTQALAFKKSGAGFTLMEILVVMLLLVAIGSLVAFANFDILRGYNFRGECDLVISLLQKARSQSINNICLGVGCTEGRPHGVYIQSDKYTIFQGSDWGNRDFNLVIGDMDEDFEASSNISKSGITEVVFIQLSGNATFPQNPALTEGEIILNETDSFHSETIFLNNEGRISW